MQAGALVVCGAVLLCSVEARCCGLRSEDFARIFVDRLGLCEGVRSVGAAFVLCQCQVCVLVCGTVVCILQGRRSYERYPEKT